MTNNLRQFLAIASFMVGISIAIGAFGAHGLKNMVEPNLLKTFNTAVTYQFYNSLGLFGVAFISYLLPNSKKIRVCYYLILLGTLIFAVSLYALVLLNMPVLGAITPIGGTLLVIVWIYLAYIISKGKE